MLLLCLILFYCCIFNLQSKRMHNAGSARNNRLDITIFCYSLAHAFNGFHFKSNMTLSDVARVCVCVSFLCRISVQMPFVIQCYNTKCECQFKVSDIVLCPMLSSSRLKMSITSPVAELSVWSSKANPYVQHIHHCISVGTFFSLSLSLHSITCNAYWTHRNGCENAFRE